MMKGREGITQPTSTLRIPVRSPAVPRMHSNSRHSSRHVLP